MALLTKSRNSPRFTAKKYGCPAIDPVVIVKYLLVGFLYGIPSERQIERRIHGCGKLYDHTE